MVAAAGTLLVRELPSDGPHCAGAPEVRTSELLSEGTAAGSAVPAHVTTLSAADAHAILSDVRLRLRGTATRVPDPLHRQLCCDCRTCYVDVVESGVCLLCEAERAETRALIARIESQLPPWRSSLPPWVPEFNSDPHAGEGL